MSRKCSSFADMEREERALAMQHFRNGNLTQGEIHLENAITFARCDAAEMAEKALKHQ
jgi:hypothetical protein